MSEARRTRILVVDDEEAMRAVLAARLGGWGYEVELAADGAEAKRRLLSSEPDIVLTDVVLPDLSGLDLLRSFRAGSPRRPVILMTAHGTVELAVEAIKEGGEDFLTKPLDYAKLESLLERLSREAAARRADAAGHPELENGQGFGLLVGRSRPMLAVYRLIAEVADTDVPVLVTGESGTGKELVARTLHARSSRAEGPFVAVNCAAIPAELLESEFFGHERGAFTGATATRPGCFENAHRGTLFLDEIAELPVALQPKLLRVLEDGRVRRLGGRQEFCFDVRQVAATNRDPAAEIDAGRLREDLFYRLNVFHVHMPPLRERTDDLELLIQRFVEEANIRHGTRVSGMSRDALGLARRYGWPGNVRELRNVVERGVVLVKEGPIEPEQLPITLREPESGVAAETIEIPADSSLAEAERILILHTLASVGNNKAEAARRLGLDVKTVRNKLKTYGESR